MVLGEDLDAEIVRQEELVDEKKEYISARKALLKEIEAELPREKADLIEYKATLA